MRRSEPSGKINHLRGSQELLFVVVATLFVGEGGLIKDDSLQHLWERACPVVLLFGPPGAKPRGRAFSNSTILLFYHSSLTLPYSAFVSHPFTFSISVFPLSEPTPTSSCSLPSSLHFNSFQLWGNHCNVVSSRPSLQLK